MSTLAAIHSMQAQVSRAPTAHFAQAQGAFAADRAAPVAPRGDSVVISTEARARMGALQQLQTSSRVISSDQAGTGLSVMA